MSVQYRSQFALACVEPDCARLECPPQPGGSGDFTDAEPVIRRQIYEQD